MAERVDDAVSLHASNSSHDSSHSLTDQGDESLPNSVFRRRGTTVVIQQDDDDDDDQHAANSDASSSISVLERAEPLNSVQDLLPMRPLTSPVRSANAPTRGRPSERQHSADLLPPHDSDDQPSNNIGNLRERSQSRPGIQTNSNYSLLGSETGPRSASQYLNPESPVRPVKAQDVAVTLQLRGARSSDLLSPRSPLKASKTNDKSITNVTALPDEPAPPVPTVIVKDVESRTCSTVEQLLQDLYPAFKLGSSSAPERDLDSWQKCSSEINSILQTIAADTHRRITSISGRSDVADSVLPRFLGVAFPNYKTTAPLPRGEYKEPKTVHLVRPMLDHITRQPDLSKKLIEKFQLVYDQDLIRLSEEELPLLGSRLRLRQALSSLTCS